MNIRVEFGKRVRTKGAHRILVVPVGALLSVAACSSPTDFDALEIATTDLDPGAAGIAYFADLTAAGGDGVYTWSMPFGTVPAGLSLDPAGAITGTPVESGASNQAWKVRRTSSTGMGRENVASPRTAYTMSVDE